jgi:glycosyltransferase involved in cell wall biosynthesis
MSITIVTPLLNRANMLRDALASVATQGVHAEHLVVDGGSIDGSQGVATAAGAVVIDAPGSSIYEAVNIGLDRAKGDVICLLNSDDQLVDGALVAAQAAFAADSALELLRGRASVEYVGETPAHREENSAAVPLTLANVLLGVPNINACFFRTALVRRIGGFDPAYPISADRAWLARAIIAGARTATLDRLVYVYRRHPGSLTIGRGKPARSRWVREHLSWSRMLLASDQLSREHRSAVRAFHAKETAHLAVLTLRGGAPAEAARVLAGSFGRDPLWPLHAAGPLASIAARRAQRKKEAGIAVRK